MSYISLFNENVLDMVNVSLNGVGADNLIYSNNNNNLDSVTIGSGLTFSGGTLTNTVTNTDNITEGKDNLFFTDVRAQNATSGLYEAKITAGTAAEYWRGDKTFSTLDTLAVTENTNLYFTNARAVSAMAGLYETPITSGTTSQYWRGDKTWADISSIGLGVFEPVISSGTTAQYWRGDKTFSTLDTLAVTENTNLYFTNARAVSAMAGLYETPITSGTTSQYWRGDKTWADISSIGLGVFEPVISSGTTSQYWRGDKTFSTLDTLAVTENTNLYFTNARAVSACSGTYEAKITSGTTSQYWRGDKTFQTLNTDVTTEGKTNLYFTALRAQTALAGMYEPPISTGTTAQYWRGDKSWQTLNQAAISGLTTSDAPTFDKLTVTKGIINTGTGNNGSIAITTNSITAINTANLKNIYIGSYGCGNNNITGSSNFLFGNYCGTAITSGNSNILIGNTNLYTMTDGYHNYIVGSNGQTTNNSLHHTYQFGSSSNSGNNNISIGHHANNSTTNDNNTAIGAWCFAYQTSGSNNTILGYYTARGTSTAASNSNTYIGAQCGYNLQGANYNTAVGAYSLYSCSTGSNNTSVGFYAGKQCGTGSGNVFIGYQAAYNDLNPSNKLYISNSSTSTPLIYGDFATAVLTVNNNIIVSGLTASSLVATDANKKLTTSVTGLSPTFTGLNLSGLTASRLVVTDGSKNLSSQSSSDKFHVLQGGLTWGFITTIVAFKTTLTSDDVFSWAAGSGTDPTLTTCLNYSNLSMFGHFIQSSGATESADIRIRFYDLSGSLSTGNNYSWIDQGSNNNNDSSIRFGVIAPLASWSRWGGFTPYMPYTTQINAQMANWSGTCSANGVSIIGTSGGWTYTTASGVIPWLSTCQGNFHEGNSNSITGIYIYNSYGTGLFKTGSHLTIYLHY